MAVPRGSSSSAGALRVLIVDDNKDSADALAINLASDVNIVAVAHSGKAALAAASASRPDVVILDIGMVDPNGYEVARILREQYAGQRLLLIAVTGWAGEGNRQRAMDAGFDHHMVKPVATAELEELIAKWGEESS